MDKTVIFALLISFVLTASLVKALIPLLRKLKMGQKILEIGPAWHISKQGTPTMGGLAFLLAVALVCFGYYFVTGDILLCLTLCYALANGAIGILDDLLKLKRKQNEGLSAFSKFLLQLIVSAIYVVLLYSGGYVTGELYIPFLSVTVELGRLYFPFALLLLCGFTNAVNLTDGLDGLCSSVTAVVMLFFAITSIGSGNLSGAIISLAVLGAVIGFLIYNFHPAKVFMGDTGSLFLGGAVGGLALTSYKNTAVFVVGAVYLIEAGSVILQVLYYKATKKRLFLMAPFHHHLEKKGHSEVKITLLFSAITLLLAAISYLFI